MVTAGVFMVSRLSPMFETSHTALTVVTFVGAATALFVNLPVMALLARRALDCGWVSGGRALRYALFVPVALAGLILLTFALGDRLERCQAFMRTLQR
jgi:uncharacterized membrane protein YhaH (DUF805 family)